MIIPEIAVKNRTAVMVMVIILIVFGLFAYISLPREAAPDVTIPYIFVTTAYPGVAPVDIEQSITVPIENKLKGLEGIKNIFSTSLEGLSSITIEFTAGTDIDEVLPKTKDRVDMAGAELPSEREQQMPRFSGLRPYSMNRDRLLGIQQ